MSLPTGAGARVHSPEDIMDVEDPVVAQRIVAEYAALLEKHDRDNVYPAPVHTLPYPKETIKTAVRTSVAALSSTGQMTDELRDFLEIAYVSLADFVDAELARLLIDYREAGDALVEAPRLAKDKVASPAWRVLAQSGSLAGTIARSIAEEAEALRQEFRQLVG